AYGEAAGFGNIRSGPASSECNLSLSRQRGSFQPERLDSDSARGSSRSANRFKTASASSKESMAWRLEARKRISFKVWAPRSSSTASTANSGRPRLNRTSSRKWRYLNWFPWDPYGTKVARHLRLRPAKAAVTVPSSYSVTGSRLDFWLQAVRRELSVRG